MKRINRKTVTSEAGKIITTVRVETNYRQCSVGMEPEIRQRHGGKYIDNAEAGIKSLTVQRLGWNQGQCRGYRMELLIGIEFLIVQSSGRCNSVSR